MSRLMGHGLRSEGRAFARSGCDECLYGDHRPRWWGNGTGGYGHARCECGEFSPHLTSGTQRRTWHAEHKAARSKP